MFYTGDIVGLGWLNSDQKTKDLASGIVSRVAQTAITVAFDETADTLAFDDNGPFKLIKLANDITHKRIKRCMKKKIYYNLKFRGWLSLITNYRLLFLLSLHLFHYSLFLKLFCQLSLIPKTPNRMYLANKGWQMASKNVKVAQNFSEISQVSQSCFLRSSECLADSNFLQSRFGV